MNEFEHVWTRLTRLASRAPVDDADLAAPIGFSTRVVAQWLAERGESGQRAVWEWLAPRGFGIAFALAAAVAVIGWSVASNAVADEVADLADPVVLADLSN